jgi:tyrosinase
MVGLCPLGILAAASSLLPLASFASPLLAGKNALETRQDDFFVVHGIEEGGIQPRLNVRDLASKPEYKEIWTLYLLALQRLQAMDQTDKLSFYQVAGTILTVSWSHDHIT